MQKYRIKWKVEGTYIISESNFDEESFEGLSDDEKMSLFKDIEEENNLGDIDLLAEGKLTTEIEKL
jgi:hypothetical protein